MNYYQILIWQTNFEEKNFETTEAKNYQSTLQGKLISLNFKGMRNQIFEELEDVKKHY